MRAVLLALLALAGAFPQSESPVKREGYYWTQSVTGTIALPADARVRVSVRGSVTVRGENRTDVIFTLKKRAKTRTSQEARGIFSDISVKTTTAGNTFYLTVLVPDLSFPGPDLEVRLPRRLRQILIENQGGSIDAHELDGNVNVDTTGGRIIADVIGGNFTARTGGGDMQVGRIGGTARCLSGGGSIRAESIGGESWFESVGGEIYVKEAGGPVRASTAGNIVVERAARAVTAQSAGGMIEVQQAGGPVSAETSGGSIQVGPSVNVRCELGAGPIRLRGVSGALRASTGLGTVIADLLAGTRLQDSFLNTGAGDVIVTIPSNLPLRIWAQSDPACSGGKVVSEFSEIRVRSSDAPCQKPVIAEGSLNGGGPLLRVSAAGGSVYLRRQR